MKTPVFRFQPRKLNRAGEFRADDPTHKRQDPRIKERVLEQRMTFMAMLLKWYNRYNKEGLELPTCIRDETSAVTDELDAVGGWARGALEFKSGERTPVQVVYRRYVEDMEKAEKDHVGLDEFCKRIRRCYEVKQTRCEDQYKQCSRIISYQLKTIVGGPGGPVSLNQHTITHL
jgi:phage/plasmid-associated DNA primase